jgi:hypothetical protein
VALFGVSGIVDGCTDDFESVLTPDDGPPILVCYFKKEEKMMISIIPLPGYVSRPFRAILFLYLSHDL